VLIVWHIEAFPGGRFAVGSQHHRPEVRRKLMVRVAAAKKSPKLQPTLLQATRSSSYAWHTAPLQTCNRALSQEQSHSESGPDHVALLGRQRGGGCGRVGRPGVILLCLQRRAITQLQQLLLHLHACASSWRMWERVRGSVANWHMLRQMCSGRQAAMAAQPSGPHLPSRTAPPAGPR
jgi:hypothetical protein